ncbi:MAG: sulfite exporter TauE/SafE family protein [Pseudomonadota bacterium]
MQYILLGLVGATAGLFSGFFGLGGAVVIIPALVYVFGFEQQTAQGTSLAMLLPPIGLLAAWRYWQAGNVKIGASLALAVGFFFAAALGAHFAVQLPHQLMKRLFGVALLIIGGIMISGK